MYATLRNSVSGTSLYSSATSWEGVKRLGGVSMLCGASRRSPAARRGAHHQPVDEYAAHGGVDVRLDGLHVARAGAVLGLCAPQVLVDVRHVRAAEQRVRRVGGVHVRPVAGLRGRRGGGRRRRNLHIAHPPLAAA